jgi:hypothetical protein
LGDARPDDGRTPSPSFYNNNDQQDQQQQSVRVNMNDGDLDYLASQNEDEISGLSAKVKILKNVCAKRVYIRYTRILIADGIYIDYW